MGVLIYGNGQSKKADRKMRGKMQHHLVTRKKANGSTELMQNFHKGKLPSKTNL